MAERFVEVDRNTPLLLPADMRDWVLEDDLVPFVLKGSRACPPRSSWSIGSIDSMV
jgi:hypothetical protein